MDQQKLILEFPLSPGDVTVGSGALRDLHVTYPYIYKTDVRTACPAIFENNPYITPLNDDDPDVRKIRCEYPLIHESNQRPYHFLHGHNQYLEEQLGVKIPVTKYAGDIHISDKEKMWYSKIKELTGDDLPFWIINAGGKSDFTNKLWDPRRYQAVVNAFRDRILFIQVGQMASGHRHEKLDGVIDLRGQTTLRELIRLVYHAQGVLCPVTLIMHLAAAVEVKDKPRGCVVIAGGREPAHWEAYPGHQFMHTIGALDCCKDGGCWRSRTVSLNDGDEKDKPENLCVDVLSNGMPRCMGMIMPEMVVERIKTYFTGGALGYLSKDARIPEKVLSKPQLVFDIPLDVLHGKKAISEVVIKMTDGTEQIHRPNVSPEPVSTLQHDLFKPETLEEAIETVVGDCNGIPARERWEKETPLFAEAILRRIGKEDDMLTGIVADYGCGAGRIAKEIIKQCHYVKVIGTDSSIQELKLAQDYVDSDRFLMRQIPELNGYTGTVDLIYSVYTFQHIPAIEIREALQRIYDVLKDDGLFVYCSSDYRMAIRYDGKGFADDSYLGVNMQAELLRLFEFVEPLFTEADLDANPVVRTMVTGGKDGIPHPAIVLKKKLPPAENEMEQTGGAVSQEAVSQAVRDASLHDVGQKIQAEHWRSMRGQS